MIAIGKLISHPEYHLRMIAVRHAWALMYMRDCEPARAAVQFRVARELIERMRGRYWLASHYRTMGGRIWL